MDLEHVIDDFIFDRETFCTFKTVSNYKHTLKYFCDYLYGYYGYVPALEDISVSDLKGYVHFMKNGKKLQSHPFKPTVDTPITDTSIRTYLVDIRTFFNYCVKNDYLIRSPFLKFTMVKRENVLIVPLFQSDVQIIDKMYSKRDFHNSRDLCIVHVMLDAGLRSGEVCRLQDDNIDFSHNCIYVRYGKGRKDRIIPLAPSLKLKLSRYINIYRPDNYVGYTFISADHEQLRPITENTIEALFARIKKRIPDKQRIYPHLCRHTFATSFIMGGGDLESLRMFMGHADITTTSKYLHLATTFKASGSQIYKLDPIFFRKWYNQTGY